MMRPLGRLHHVAMTVPDLDAAATFYRDTLGLAEIRRKSWNDDARMDAILGVPDSAGRVMFLSDGVMGFEFFEFTAPEAGERAAPTSATQPGWMHVCLRVDDLAAVYASLREKGMSFWTEPSLGPTGNIAVYGRDPFGNLIELTQFTDDVG
jgi:catechol 2,3-dioxygenase-like lactoylglutathione lyase family enzyme